MQLVTWPNPCSQSPRSLWKIRYFVDTEFTDFLDCQLISVAIVGEDGREFYGECSDFDRRQCSAFVREAALPQLGQGPSRSMPSVQLRDELPAWLLAVPAKPKPILCFHAHAELLAQSINRLEQGKLA
ncbi:MULTISPECIES: hypothetical protein [Cupriavidus]|nr:MULTISPECIES: hypothetical protein [Cupriavidus]